MEAVEVVVVEEEYGGEHYGMKYEKHMKLGG